MGYVLSKLKYLPCTFDWYLFLVGNYQFHSRINDLFREDFEVIAGMLGDNAAIVKPSYYVECELQDLLKHMTTFCVANCLRQMEKKYPGLMLVNNNPIVLDSDEIYERARKKADSRSVKQDLYLSYLDELKETAERMKIIYIPFKILDKVYKNNNLLMEDLVAFVTGENKDLVKKTSKIGRMIDRLEITATVNLGIITFNYEL